MRVNVLRMTDGGDGGGAVAPSVEELQRRNAELQEQLAAVKKPGALTPEQEKIVRQKIAAGLTREQSIAVLQAQEAWDADPNNSSDDPPKPRRAAK